MASTIRDVAALAGLSLGTVSKYINGTPVKEENKIQIENAIQKLNYRPNHIAKGLRNSKSFSIAVLVPMLTSNFCTSMISSLESYLLTNGYSVIVCECHNNVEMELQKIKFLLDRMVDGIVLLPYSTNGKQIQLIQESGTPLVLIDQRIAGYDTDSVVLNNMEAGFQPTSHLIELGHTQISIITGALDHYTTKGRLGGYLKAFEEAGLPVNPDFLQCGDYSIDGGYDAMLRLMRLEHPPTAVFISNYDMTIGAYLAINYLNLKIPKDISIIGFDNFPLTNVINPPLSFAEQPTDDMGFAVGQLLYKRIQGDYSDYPQTITYPPVMHYKSSIQPITNMATL